MNKQEQTALMQKCKDESAKELGYEDFNDANAWMVTHEQQFTTDPANNIMFNILELAMGKYAKSVAVGFAEYISTEEYEAHFQGAIGTLWSNTLELKPKFQKPPLHTEELYTKYTEQ